MAQRLLCLVAINSRLIESLDETKSSVQKCPRDHCFSGSVARWLCGTLHGAGANTSLDWRYGVFLTYSLGWVRQEENQ
tara:strand:+ start:906 stop:1139 length:234 start_codon:yes stop_codon:yes gene_type:complete